MTTDQSGAGALYKAALERTEGSDALWEPLRDAWLTWRVASEQDLHVKGGYSWRADAYQPVLLWDAQEGRGAMAFEPQAKDDPSAPLTAAAQEAHDVAATAAADA